MRLQFWHISYPAPHRRPQFLHFENLSAFGFTSSAPQKEHFLSLTRIGVWHAVHVLFIVFSPPAHNAIRNNNHSYQQPFPPSRDRKLCHVGTLGNMVVRALYICLFRSFCFCESFQKGCCETYLSALLN